LEGGGVLVPAPVDAGLGEAGVADDLGEALAGLLLGDVALGDVLLEGREEEAEERDVLAEEAGGGDAARVEGGEGHAGGLVVPPVELLHRQHVAHLAVLVGLGAVELAAVDHRRRAHAVQPRRQPPQVPQVRLRRHVPRQR
uniref:Uncharacterized protein n=1 Tax=Oryza brachyantha TaxID=4533 RepID=J3N3R4_ORYBR